MIPVRPDRKNLLCYLFAVVCTVALSQPVHAQGNNAAAAEALFDEGRELMKQRKYVEAIAKLKASDAADPAVGARISIGQCNEALGKTASAWASYKSAANLATQKGDNRAKDATELADKLESQLTFVVLEVDADARVAGLEISFDGAVKPDALYNQRFPVDPGSHTASARADGFEPWEHKVDAGKPGEVVTVKVPRLEQVATPVETKLDPAASGAGSGGAQTGLDPAPAVDEPGTDPGRGRRRLGLGVGIGGAAALATGLVFGGIAKAKWDDSRDHCDETVSPNVCDKDGLDLIDSARTNALVSTILVGAGVAAIGTGVVLYLTAPDGPEKHRTAVRPVVSPNQVGFALSGSF